jgi:NADPH-dependent ferric siderophore reductase
MTLDQPAVLSSPVPLPPVASASASQLRRVQRVRHELRRRDVAVSRVDRLSAGFVSVTFADPSLASFVSDSFDDHVKFLFPGNSGETVGRDFTPRAFDRDACTLTIEFALHADGASSNWARHARPGHRVTIGGPRGSMVVPFDYDWHLLAGDSTALPAIHRRLEELPPGTHATVVVQADAADQRPLASSATLDVTWVPDGDGLLAALRALPPKRGQGFAWCAGEASAMARVRDVWLTDKAHPREAMRVAAYWKRGAAAFHENLEA